SAAEVMMNEEFLSTPEANRKSGLRNFRARFAPADAPPAASSRALRCLWAAEMNRVLRRTGDLDEARRAGAEMLVAALDCDALVYRSRRQTRACTVPVNLP